MQVVTGPRQVGKTTIMRQVLAGLGVKGLFVSADEPTLRDTAWLAGQWEAARAMVRDDGPRGVALALDEVQKITGWSETVKRLWDEDTASGIALRVVLLGSAPLRWRSIARGSSSGRGSWRREAMCIFCTLLAPIGRSPSTHPRRSI